MSSEELRTEALAAGRLLADAEAVIFDVDGTLIDTRDAHLAAWREAFRDCGKQVSADRLSALFGSSAERYLEALLTEQERARIGDDVLRAKFASFARRMMELPPLPAASEILRHLHHDGKRLALASGALRHELDHYLRLLGDDGVIAASVSLDDVSHGKPDPETFIKALQAVAVEPARSVVVGDSTVDACAAGPVQIACIGVLTGGFPAEALRAAGMRHVCVDVAELHRGYLAAAATQQRPGQES